jgi:hypothetical protein
MPFYGNRADEWKKGCTAINKGSEDLNTAGYLDLHAGFRETIFQAIKNMPSSTMSLT